MERGTVIKSTGSRYRVLDEAGATYECTLRGKFREKGSRNTNPVAVGDHVTFDPAEKLITGIMPRQNYIIRRSSNLSRESQIIAANIDQAFLMITIKMPVTPLQFIDRFLATAEAYRVPSSILINKSDLYSPEEKEEVHNLMRAYERIGYRVYLLSVEREEGTADIREAMRDKITLLSGNSGVGKSSLLNLLAPRLKLRTGVISDYHEQGRHITTYPEMHPMPFGGFVIDTPGIRGFGVIDFAKSEIYHFFPEIFRISEKCRYYNCLHLEEPQCAVREAVATGEIEAWRYKSYVTMMIEENSKYR